MHLPRSTTWFSALAAALVAAACAPQPPAPAPAPLGYDFRAVGQEPGWSLDLRRRDGWLHLTLDYGRTRLAAAATPAATEPGGATVYTARTDVHELRVRIEPERCRDVMSGEAFPARVVLSVDGREYRGCGRPLDGPETNLTSPPLRGTYWKLVELGGQPVRRGGDAREPHLRLLADEPRLSGATGCNHLLGGFESDGDMLRLTGVGMTRMACVDPMLAEQEQRFVAALQRVARYRLADSRLALLVGTDVLAQFVAVERPGG